MGLFVVARLAARHGIRVRLRPAASGGLIALVWLPDEAIMHDTPDGSPGQRTGPAISEPVIGPVTDGVFAGANGALTSAWGDVGRGTRAGQDADLTKAPPKFAPLRADAEETGLGPKRVPGAGPRPGTGWDQGGTTGATTGPQPSFRTVPRPASNGGSEPAATGPQPVVGAGPVASAGPGAQAPADAAEVADTFSGTFDPFAALSQPDDGGVDAPADTSPHPVLGAPAAVTQEPPSTSRGAVIVPPPADDLGERNRLPIFEAVESDWFRRGRQAVGRPAGGHDGEVGNGNGWASPSDEGWQAAEVVHAPSSGGVTSAGLPKRVPRANLVPGAATAAGASGLAPTRSAAATRDRFASFQRGSREGRAAANVADSDDGENENSE
jgi:hypothetical protein